MSVVYAVLAVNLLTSGTAGSLMLCVEPGGFSHIEVQDMDCCPTPQGTSGRCTPVSAMEIFASFDFACAGCTDFLLCATPTTVPSRDNRDFAVALPPETAFASSGCFTLPAPAARTAFVQVPRFETIRTIVLTC